MSELLYSKKHIWIKGGGTTDVLLGITDYAQEKLGTILFLALPDIGEKLNIGERFGDIESVKTVTDLISPVDGVVVEVNEKLLDEPEEINENPHQSWLIKVEVENKQNDLMDWEDYDAYKGTL